MMPTREKWPNRLLRTLRNSDENLSHRFPHDTVENIDK